MADAAEGRQVAEDLENKGDNDEEPQQPPDPRTSQEGDRSGVTVDSVVDAFFAAGEGQDDDSGDRGNGEREGQTETAEYNSDDDEETRVQLRGVAADGDGTDDESRTKSGDGEKPAVSAVPSVSQQQASAEAGDGVTEKEIGKELSLADRSLSPRSPELKRDSSEERHPGSGDESGEGREEEDSFERDASLTQAKSFHTEDNHSADKDERSQKRESDQNQAEEARLKVDPEQCFELEDVDEDADLVEDRQDMHTVAQDLVQQVLDKVIKAESDTGEEETPPGAASESKTNADFPELDKVDLNSEDWDTTEGLGRASSALDDASLTVASDADVDGRQDIDKLLSDSEQVADFDRDVNELEAESDHGDSEPCEREAELQGESQLVGDYIHSPASSPRSQGENVAAMEEGNNRQEHQSELRPSPKAEYPLNYDNYKVCRMLSPSVKECLILETGEQILYDTNSFVNVGDSQGTAASRLPTRVPSQVERVKRSLFSDRAQDAADARDSAPVPTAPPTSTHSDAAAATRSTDRSSPPANHSRPQQQQYSSRDRPSSREVEAMVERAREMDESHDGSYLWLQRQVQWRAGSSVMPETRATREAAHVDRKATSPRSGYSRRKEERRGDVSRGQDISREDRLGSSSLGSTEVSGSVPSPGAIPNFNTLRDQQVSWLSMYRMLEEQHRTQLQAQYTEHQQMINDMQRQLEEELLTQQNSMRQKLDSHREALREPGSAPSYSKTQGTTSSWYGRHSPTSQSRGDTDISQLSSHSSPLEQKDAYARGATRSLPGGTSQRSSWEGMRSPPAPEIGGEKRLRGGVYSSPMPTAKFRSSARESTYAGSTTTVKRSQGQEVDYRSEGRDASAQSLSPRSQVSLREKHAKHLSDLRSYYEAEIQDLRHKLSAASETPLYSLSTASTGRESARERILQEENQMLRLQLRDLQDSLDDSQIYSRELEQKLQGLDRRATDYAERYEESQNNVLKLKNRLEELHSYAKDRESVLEQAQANERRQTTALQELYKAKEEQEETARRDNGALKRLLDKYELLEKDYNALKETSADFEQKLFDARSETVQLNKTIAQLELENKRMTHDNDNMRHRLAVSGSLPLSRQELAETQMSSQSRHDYGDLNGYPTASQSLTHTDTHVPRGSIRRDVTPTRRGLSDEEDSNDLGKSDSPLLRAERELRRLQQTLGRGEFVPRLQPKKYTATDPLGPPASGEVTIIDAFSSPSRSASNASVDSGTRDGLKKGKKTFVSQATKRDRPLSSQNKLPAARSPGKSSVSCDGVPSASVSSPTRFDVGISQTGSRSPVTHNAVAKKGKVGRDAAGETRENAKSGVKSTSKGENENKQWVDATLERVRSGEFVSRPQWEDVYTSLAKPAQPDKSCSMNMTQEEMLRDRIQSIDQMERRYDALQVEKRKLESQLNKVPSHGRDRKSRREKELLEEKLDNVDHELGSVRMTLKRYQVLKSTF